MASAPFKVKAVFEYTSSHEDDLPFQIGQIITVTDQEDIEWYGGEYVDDSGVKKEGIFPRNFVEKFEPTAPPRPIRARKKDPELAPVAPAAPPSPPPAVAASPEEQQVDPPELPSADAREEISAPVTEPPPVEQSHPPEAPSVPVANPPEIAPVPALAPIESKNVDLVGSSGVDAPPKSKSPPPAQARSPPPVVQKPKSNAFKDRIAAFNRPAAPPIAPFKPSGLGSGSSGFVKKPFVAPPPSRNAYVPPPRDAPAPKIYRREEDPDITGTRGESVDAIEKVTPISVLPGNSDSQNEDQPKPTTLKERIALLQKQQAEAAQAIAKKEKPVRPPKKRLESNGPQEATAATQATEAPPPPLGRQDSADINSKNSMDESHSTRQSLNINRAPTDPIEKEGNGVDKLGAGDTTEGQETPSEHKVNDEKLKSTSREDTAPEGQAMEEDEEEEEEDVDPEVRRKEELRARMAKMSGGMGMAGMFGPPGMMGIGGGIPVKKPKPSLPAERRPSGLSEGPSSPRATAPPIPTMMALPGMAKLKGPEEALESESKQEPIEEEAIPGETGDGSSPAPDTSQSTGAPPVPEGRPAPPPIPTESRPPPPPPPPAAVVSPSVGSESDDELSEHTSKPLDTSKAEISPTNRGLPPVPMASPPLPTSPRFSSDSRNEETSPVSPGFSTQQSKRNSRPPPPIPGVAPLAPMQTRPPPPLPPTSLSRASTGDELAGVPLKPSRQDNGGEEEGTEYEADYDTDIASSAHNKDALKAHAADPGYDDNSSVRSPTTEHPPTIPSPIPSSTAPRTGPPPIPRSSLDFPQASPPPIPSQPAPRSRVSIDSPRAAPPPPPPKATTYTYDDDDDEYDPYNYNSAQTPPLPSHNSPMREGTGEIAPHQAPPPPPPPPPPSSTADRRAPPTPTSSRAPPRKSVDILRPSVGKRSMDAARHSVSLETGFMANEVDLSAHTQWWLSRNGVPPAFQGRKDVYTETNESNSTENGRNFVTKEVSILFQDYSQTIVAVRFDPNDPSQTELDQRQEPPPRALRQDELEEAYERFGRRLAHAVASKKDSVVGDGTPYALVYELLRPLNEALLPVGSRAYGALVYANLANAATQLNDEIRPGDIISIRNAKFQGKHGPMHAKYTMEVGKPDHVAIVAEWDGTKKKVRAWEQGRENKKVKQESYKLEDLRSGEVKIWRVMPRTWVGWASN
ncbi:hypothetical protein F5B22DRAFT_588182, partial [Xylaria bambusicola]|uniref:uncharacterized protein n=1 Tax=Xylaria bambusicola TaxID=326684 RepID=UPI0020082412